MSFASPSKKRPRRIITGHRDHPPPSAARPAVPRELGHAAAHAFRRGGRARSHRPRRHRRRLRRHDARLCGPRASVRRPGRDADRAALAHPQQHQLSLGPLLAARPRAVGSRRQARGPAGLEAARRPVRPRARLCLVGHAARRVRAGRRRGALSRAGVSRAEDPLPSRRLARRRQGARGGARPRRRQARSDGRLQSGLAHVVGRLSLVVAEGRRARSRASWSASASTGWRSRCIAATARACGACATRSTSASPAAR